MSRVIKLRLGARQARLLEMVVALAASGSADEATREACKRALRQMARDPSQVLEGISFWCQCGHQHDRVTVTGMPALDCCWAFCSCKFINPRPEPTAQEKTELGWKLEHDRKAYRERRSKG